MKRETEAESQNGREAGNRTRFCKAGADSYHGSGQVERYLTPLIIFSTQPLADGRVENRKSTVP
jgi:hypothetical protein